MAVTKIHPIKSTLKKALDYIESRMLDLQNAVAEGFDSGIAEGFDPERHLQHLKARCADD